MIVTRSIEQCRIEREKLRRVAFVPTMGALHEGHLSLVKIARDHAPHVIVSIFVNPTQFGPNEDFAQYPRPVEQDMEMCRQAGVDMVFNPEPSELYPANAPELRIDLPQLTQTLEGQHRPTHFRGVCQVVAKLFNIVQPQMACFGRKDFQQLAVISAMAKALDFPIEIIGCPIVRDPDGLAMSSRNRFLAPDQRSRALSISRGLNAAKADFAQGLTQSVQLIARVQTAILDPGNLAHVPVTIDYVAAVDASTLQPVTTVTGRTAILVAARVGSTRLIDNVVLGA